MKPQLLVPARRTWRRELPSEGVIPVAPGQTVDPATTVAQGQTAAPPVVIDLGQAQATVTAGQEVQAGDVVARRKKFLGSGEEVRAPVAGRVLLIAGAELLLQPPALDVALQAQLPGSVAAVRDGWSADIEGCFGLIRGYGGSGSSQHGLLGQELAIETEPLTISRIQAFAGQGVAAIVAPSWGDPPLPAPVLDGPAIFLTEPAPGTPMAPPIADILKRHLGQPAAIDLGRQPRLAFQSNSTDDGQAFEPGAWVRTARGSAGRLISIAGPRFFASGVRAAAAEIDLGDRTETLPLDSLEWIA
jgi:hypothetical protein